MLSGQRPLGSNIQTARELGARGNEQRLTIGVTPSPRLEDLQQGLGMPGHASSLSRGHLSGQPVSTSLRISARAGTPQGRPVFSIMYKCHVSVTKVTVCLTPGGNPEGSPSVGIPPDVVIKVSGRGFTLEAHA